MIKRRLNSFLSIPTKKLTMNRQWLFVVAFVLALVSCNDGSEKTYWENGKLKSVLRYQDGKLNGECRWYYSDGKLLMQAEYQDDMKNGHLVRWHQNGILEEDCWYKAGQLDSVCRSYAANGMLIAETHYDDGKLNGDYRKWYDNGQLFQEGQYKEGMMDGDWYIFYPEGQLASMAHYDKGKGKQTGYDEMGCKIMEVTYLDNKKHGKEIRYAPNGTVLQEVDYEYGKIVSETPLQ